jgi:ribose/xylose/arabinose/galactoside ABC-type transport system permease subunit
MPDGYSYFSRTLADRGPMRKIQGTSDWREFELPFNMMGVIPAVVAIEINVVMPGKGTIELSGLTISDVPNYEWFSSRASGFIGGTAGSAMGLYGALFGCLAGVLVPRGKGRKLVIGMLVFLFVIGIVLLLIGGLAVFLGQPWHVWYPFMLLGGLSVFLPPSIYFSIKKQYDQFEHRRMQALDM